MIRTLVSHSLLYGVTHIAARGTLLVSLLVLPAILAPADYGALAMLTLAGSLAAAVVPLQVAQGLARQFDAEREEADKRRFSSSAWWFTIATQIVFLIAGQIFADWGTALLLGDQGYRAAFRIALAVMVLNSLFFFLQSQFRWAFRRSDFVVVTLIYSLLTLSLSIGLALLSPAPLRGVLTGQAIGAGAAVAWGVWRLRDHLLGTPDARRLREMLRFSVPLVPSVLSVSLILYASRIVLNDMATLADVGILTFANQIAAIAGLAIVGVQAAMTPIVNVHHHEPGTPRALGRVFQAFCAGAVIVCLGLGLFAPEVILLMGAAEYAAAAPLVLLLAPALLLTEMYIFAPGFWIARRTGLQAAVSVASALIAIAAAYVLIARFGILGAVLSSLLSATLFFAVWWKVSGRFYPVPVQWSRIAIYVVLAGGAGTAALLLTVPATPFAIAAKLLVLAFAAGLSVVTGLVPWREGVVAALSLVRRSPPLSSAP